MVSQEVKHALRMATYSAACIRDALVQAETAASLLAVADLLEGDDLDAVNARINLCGVVEGLAVVGALQPGEVRASAHAWLMSQAAARNQGLHHAVAMALGAMGEEAP